MVGKEFFSILQKKLATFRSSFRFQNTQASAQAGFTLVELLTVISIMALISSIMIANVAEARRSAQDARSLQNVGSIMTALQAFYLDHGYWPSLSGNASDTYYFDSSANKYSACPTQYICTLDTTYGSSGAFSETTQCNGKRPCQCGTTPEQRSQMGWLPFLDGSYGPQDAYFTPQSTPRDEWETSCNVPFGFSYSNRYLAQFFSDGTNNFTFNYLLRRPRPYAKGRLEGCNAVFCLYSINGDTNGNIK